MGIKQEDWDRLILSLNERDRLTLFDIGQYFLNRPKRSWEEIAQREPDDIPLNEEELSQLNSDEEYVSWEQVKNELNL